MGTSNRKLTEQQAYRAMLKFLERHYDRTESEDVAALLGSVSLLDDGGSADAAALEEWRECVASVLAADKGDLAAE